MSVTEQSITKLKFEVQRYLTEKRYLHTLAVEKEVEALGRIYLKDKILQLRCAAILHDITKVLSLEKQLHYCEKFGIMTRKGDLLSPKTFHAKTGAALAKELFPSLVTEEIAGAIRWHTTGRDEMSLFEALVYLADYIEETRTFPDCVELRDSFYSALNEGKKDPLRVLYETMVTSFDMTIKNLISEGAPIDSDTVGARNFYISKLKLFPESENEE